MGQFILEISDLYYSYSRNCVLNGIDFSLLKGEIHALLGQNATGKSTLVKAIMGIIKPDSGFIKINDRKLQYKSRAMHNSSSVYTLYQDINLFPNLSVIENIFIKKLQSVYRPNFFNDAFQELKKKFQISLNGNAMVERLGAGEKKIVELLKAYVNATEIVILDEPAAFFTEVEIRFMYQIMIALKNEGKTVLLITHRIANALEYSDRVSVMYDGKIVRTFVPFSLADNDVLKMMTGKNLKDRYPKITLQKGEPLLRVQSLTSEILHDVSFSLYRGEILGITGLAGCGKTSVGKALFGLKKPNHGKVYANAARQYIENPLDAVRSKIGYIVEDSINNLVPDFDGVMNITLCNLDKVLSNGFLSMKKEQEISKLFFKKMLIDTKALKKKVRSYSGGEKQKLCLGRYLLNDVEILIIDEPTKGVDIPAKSDVYNLMNDFISKGKGIILLTSDLTEACGMCDRIIILNKGRITGEFSRSEIQEEQIISLAT